MAPGDLEMARTETWHPTGDGQARGTIEVAVPGAPVSAIGKVMLVSLATGSRLDFSTTVRVNIPLVGGQVENFIVNRLGRRDQRGAALHRQLDRGAPLSAPCVVDGMPGRAGR